MKMQVVKIFSERIYGEKEGFKIFDTVITI